jgi:SDR family mycofactocin-dependent oxidoreductase
VGSAEGKVAFITGAARGQGRSHALRLAQEGADIIAIDLCAQIASVPYPLATEDDLAETVRQVEALGRRIVARRADVRDFDAVQAALDDGLGELGHVDIVCANAGIVSYGSSWELTSEQWRDMLDVNLTGAWHTAKAAIPSMIARGQGGLIVLTSSAAGLKGIPNLAHYTAAKHGIVGLMRTLMNELSEHNIRVNSLHPSSVYSDMSQNDATYALFRPDLENPTQDDAVEGFRSQHPLPMAWLEPADVSNALAWLASDQARYVTGVALPIDAGLNAKAG